MEMEKARIMVVEDEAIIAADISAILQKLGYDVVHVACSAEEAIQKAAELFPDIVLTDIFLKGATDGIAAAEKIRTTLGIPVVFLTANSDESVFQKAKKTEPFGYVLKPFEESDELIAAVRQVLTDNQRKRDTARMQALRPLFNVTETLFSETDRTKLLDLIVNAIRDHLHCAGVACGLSG